MARDDAERWRRLTELLTPFHGAALGTARRLAGSGSDGDDLFQETLLRAHARLDALRDETRFRPWFFAILLSLHRSFSRRSFWRRFLPLSETVAQGREPAASPERGEDEWSRARRARAALSRLPAVQREAIVLHDVEGFSVEEIAVMQEVSASAVKSRLSRGRDRLRRFYLRRGWAQGAKGVAGKHGATGTRMPQLATSPGTAASGEEV